MRDEPFFEAFGDIGDIFADQAATRDREKANAVEIAQPFYCPAAFLALPFWSTSEAADYLRRKPKTLRTAYATTGAFLGVAPKKVGRRLLWPAVKIRALVEGEAA
ncbi:hypothetical protein [Paraburkholderia sp. BCC1885]|uniref:hypothetical protein n=1 Tax=Paraburkholderia sp. BCC1885 TaxID=2562669 RepID=UPI001182E200|nr:hypothetical protein [Paraburkholderia sp. BCC1885]